jgi:hypothetical protein
LATYLTDLADVLRAAGLSVVEVAGWKTRGHGGMAAVSSILVHHTAGAATGNYPSLSVVRDGRAGLPGPLAQLGVGRDGTWYVIAAGLSYHAGAVDDARYGNSRAIGVEAEGTGYDAWPQVQYDSLVRGVAALTLHYKTAVARGHKEAAVPAGRKIDPNFDMDQFRRDVLAGSGLSGGGFSVPTAPAAAPAPAPTAPAIQSWTNQPNGSTTFPDNYADLVTDGGFGALTVGAWQILAHAIGRANNRQWDGIFGPRCVRDMQEWLRDVGEYPTSRYVIDGDFGPATVKALQRFLRAKGLYGTGYVIDGSFGPATVKAFQSYLNTQN